MGFLMSESNKFLLAVLNRCKGNSITMNHTFLLQRRLFHLWHIPYRAVGTLHSFYFWRFFFHGCLKTNTIATSHFFGSAIVAALIDIRMTVLRLIISDFFMGEFSKLNNRYYKLIYKILSIFLI